MMEYGLRDVLGLIDELIVENEIEYENDEDTADFREPKENSTQKNSTEKRKHGSREHELTAKYSDNDHSNMEGVNAIGNATDGEGTPGTFMLNTPAIDPGTNSSGAIHIESAHHESNTNVEQLSQLIQSTNEEEATTKNYNDMPALPKSTTTETTPTVTHTHTSISNTTLSISENSAAVLALALGKDFIAAMEIVGNHAVSVVFFATSAFPTMETAAKTYLFHLKNAPLFGCKKPNLPHFPGIPVLVVTHNSQNHTVDLLRWYCSCTLRDLCPHLLAAAITVRNRVRCAGPYTSAWLPPAGSADVIRDPSTGAPNFSTIFAPLPPVIPAE